MTATSASVGERLIQGFETSVIGIAVVFTVLIILILALQAMGKVLAEKDTPPDNDVGVEAPVAVQIQQEQQAKPGAIDANIIAVIAASIAAYTGKTTSEIKVASIKRISNPDAGWAALARQEILASRRV